MKGCATRRLELTRDEICPQSRCVWFRAFWASFREGLGIELGGERKLVISLPRAGSTAVARVRNPKFERRVEGLR